MVTVTRLQCNLINATSKGKDMKCTFENVIESAPSNWDGDLISLSDELKDLAVYSWFEAHPSWIDDYLPEAVHEYGCKIMSCLYSGNFSDVSVELLLSNCRKIYSLKNNLPIEGNEDVFFGSAALGSFEDDCTNAVSFIGDERIDFADMLKELIYLSLETTLRSKLFGAQGLEESYSYN